MYNKHILLLTVTNISVREFIDISMANLISILKQQQKTKITHQQLLGFYFIVTSILLAFLLNAVAQQSPQNIQINEVIFHFFRHLRTPVIDNIMLSISFLGDKYVLLPLSLTLFAWLIWKQRYIAWHILFLGMLALGSVKFIKPLVHSPRPGGVVDVNFSSHFSFPSGHTTLAVVYYFLLAFLLIKAYKIKRYQLVIYAIAAIPVIAIFLARLYFGVHWLTDIMGSALLGFALLMLILLFYNFIKVQEHLAPKGIVIVSLLTLLVTYSVTFYFTFDKLKSAYTMLESSTLGVKYAALDFRI